MNAHNEGSPRLEQELSDLRRRNAELEALLREKEEGLPGAVQDVQQPREGLKVSPRQEPTAEVLGGSETLLGTLLRNMPDVVIVADAEGRIVYANHSPVVASPDQLIDRPALDFVAPEFHDVATQSGLRMLETGQPQTYEMRDVRGGWWLCRSMLLPGASGQFQTLTICTDISRRKEQEDSLRKSETELRCLFDNIPDLVLMVDGDARIQFVNRPAPGASVREMLGTPGFAFIAPEFQTICHESLALAFASRTPQYLEMRDVFDHWWDCRLVPMTTEDGSAGEVMIICSDVTRRKRTELSLRESERQYRLIAENSLDFIWTARMPQFPRGGSNDSPRAD